MSFQSSYINPFSPISPLISSAQVSLGLPRFLHPGGRHFITSFGNLPSSTLWKWLHHWMKIMYYISTAIEFKLWYAADRSLNEAVFDYKQMYCGCKYSGMHCNNVNILRIYSIFCFPLYWQKTANCAVDVKASEYTAMSTLKRVWRWEADYGFRDGFNERIFVKTNLLISKLNTLLGKNTFYCSNWCTLL
jgi:hypothetical protein